MHQRSMFKDTLAEALEDVVYAIGGPKAVASALWPAKFQANPETTARYVSQCLNARRSEKFALEEIEWLVSAGRQTGVHTVMSYLARQCNYAEPEPIEPESERDALQREYIAAIEAQREIVERLEALSSNVTHMRRRDRRGEH